MKENKIKKVLEDIRMTEEKKEEIWDEIMRKAGYASRARRKLAVAVAILALFLIPAGVYAAGGFRWNWYEDEKNEQLDGSFRRENGCLEAEGFHFRVEQAVCDNKVGIGYYYLSVTDVSGKGRNLKNYLGGTSEESIFQLKPGDVYFEISGASEYDEKNSTDEKMYLYAERDASIEEEAKDMNRVEISFIKVLEVKPSGKVTGELLGTKVIPVRNVVKMQTLTWKIESDENDGKNTSDGKQGETKVIVSNVLARVINEENPKFAIELKNGTVIRDYFRKSGETTIPENSFQIKDEVEIGQNAVKEPEVMYRMNYIDMDEVNGIYLDGVFYPSESAERME